MVTVVVEMVVMLAIVIETVVVVAGLVKETVSGESDVAVHAVLT